MADTVRYQGVLVSANGLVFRPDGSLIKPIPLYRKKSDGTKQISTLLIEYVVDGIKQKRSYQRFVYAAFNPDFDIERTDLVVTSTSDNKFEIRVKYLTHMTRREMNKAVGQGNLKFQPEDREKIAQTFRNVEGIITKKDFAKEIGTTVVTLNKILEEYPHVKREN